MRTIRLAFVLWLSAALVGFHRVASGHDESERARATSAATITAEGITVEQLAARIAAVRGRPSIVLLYGTQCSLTEQMFTEFATLARRHPEVAILAFATDEDLADEVEPFLARHGANFAAVYIRDWPAGALTKALEPLGIRVGTPWTRPLIAIRDAEERVVAQAQGATNLAPVERTLAQMR